MSGGGQKAAYAKGSSGSGGARNVTQAPFNVKESDFIGVSDRLALAAEATAAAGADSGAFPSSDAARWWESATPASSEEWARAFDGPADHKARDAVATAVAAVTAAEAPGDGVNPKEKEIALELGAAKDWERDSDEDNEGEVLDEIHEAFGKNTDKECRSKGIGGTGTGYG